MDVTELCLLGFTGHEEQCYMFIAKQNLFFWGCFLIVFAIENGEERLKHIQIIKQIYLISGQRYGYLSSPVKANRSVMDSQYCHLTAGMKMYEM